MKIRHNKKRNTAFVYEALVKEVTVAIIKNDKERKSKVINILKKHFKDGSALAKQLECYRSLYETRSISERASEKIIQEVGNNCCESLSNKRISEVKNFIFLSDLYIGNDSFGHHISSQMGKPSFVILLDTPRAYSDYSVNQNRILPPNVSIDVITHDSKFDPNLVSVDMIIERIKKFI